MSVVINPQSVIGQNNTALETQIDQPDRVQHWLSDSAFRQLVQVANMKIVRNFDFRSGGVKPCTSWNEATQTGTWNWTVADNFVNTVLGIGAEPLFALGWAQASSAKIPSGMAVNPTTSLPYPNSWAAYCREWVKHFGNKVRLYETMNEPWAYFGTDATKLGYFKDVFNAASVAMRAENPNVMVSFDGTDRRFVLDFWLANGGANLDFISFHKYDAWQINQYSDATMLNMAETYFLETGSTFYGVKDSRQLYYNARGKWIPVMNTEGNFSSAWETGTDPKIQQMVGATWLALNLRKSILLGLDMFSYFEATSSKSWQSSSGTGWGFGMINMDDDQPWLPYLVCRLIGERLSVGDSIVDSSTTNSNLRVLAWKHQGVLCVLLINKSTSTIPVTLSLSGFNYLRLDSSVNADYPTPNTGVITNSITLNGYTVMLLEQTAPTERTYVFQNWNNNPSDTANPKTIVL